MANIKTKASSNKLNHPTIEPNKNLNRYQSLSNCMMVGLGFELFPKLTWYIGPIREKNCIILMWNTMLEELYFFLFFFCIKLMVGGFVILTWDIDPIRYNVRRTVSNRLKCEIMNWTLLPIIQKTLLMLRRYLIL